MNYSYLCKIKFFEYFLWIILNTHSSGLLKVTL